MNISSGLIPNRNLNFASLQISNKNVMNMQSVKVINKARNGAKKPRAIPNASPPFRNNNIFIANGIPITMCMK